MKGGTTPMPRNVRNFWIDAQIDGRTVLTGGPKGKGGGAALPKETS